MLEVSTNHLKAVQPVDGENNKNGEVRNQEQVIEQLQVVQARERVVKKRVIELVAERRCEEETGRGHL